MASSVVYDIIKEKLEAMLKDGVVPWKCPYKTDKPVNPVFNVCRSARTKQPYSLINQFILGLDEGEYWTQKQINEHGYRLLEEAPRDGYVVFWKMCETKDKDEPEYKKHVFPTLRYYRVFHERYVDGLTKHSVRKVERINELTPSDKRAWCEAADDCIVAYFGREDKLDFHFRNTETPVYSVIKDRITIPRSTHFDSMPEYYTSFFHEMIHSTGAKHRLNRDLSGISKPKEYCREELVAEIGASVLCSEFGIMDEKTIENSSTYIAYWMDILKNKIEDFVWATSRAEKAVAYILGQQVVE